MVEQSKKISPSLIIKHLFPDDYKNVPEWILEQAAEFGKEMHESFALYIENKDMDAEIVETLSADKKIKLYNSFKRWFTEQKIKAPKTELYVSTTALHGYIDLISLKDKKFYDYKFRNIDKNLDISKDIVQMLIYAKILKIKYNAVFNWELIYFDKKTGQIYTYKEQHLDKDYKEYLKELIEQTILILINTQGIKKFNYDDLEKWASNKKFIEIEMR